MFETSADAPLPVRVISQRLSEYIGKLGAVWVEGEISQINDRNGSSMIYMRLRDTSVDMSLNITCHRSVFNAVSPLPESKPRC